jgi:ligand-binding sensor domain-containing protein
LTFFVIPNLTYLSVQSLYLLLLLFFVTRAEAQTAYGNRFIGIGMKEGLSNSHLNDLQQDRFGFFWIATRKGLNRYDGKNFLQFFSDSSRNSLPDDNVLRLKMLPGDQLAALTRTGLFIINTKTLASKTLIIPPDKLIYEYKVNVVMDVAGDEDGNTYILTRSGFYVFNSGGELSFRYDHYTANDVESRVFAFGYSISRVSASQYLVNNMNGPWIFDSKEKKLFPADNKTDPYTRSLIQPSKGFRAVYQDPGGFFILTRNGSMGYFSFSNKKYLPVILPSNLAWNIDHRSRINKLSDSVYTICGAEKGYYFLHYRPQEMQFTIDTSIQFSAYQCRAVWLGIDGRQWVATNKGLFKGSNDAARVESFTIPRTVFDDSTDISFRGVKVIGEKIYAYSTEGLFILDRATGSFLKHFDFASVNPTAKNIFSILPLTEDSLLIGPNASLIVFNPRTDQYSALRLPGWEIGNWIPSMNVDKEGNLFVAVNDEGKIYIRRKGTAFSMPQKFEGDNYRILVPTNITTDAENNTWFCGHGVTRYNIKSGVFDESMDNFPRMKTGRKEVMSLVFDASGNRYMAVNQNGLLIYRPGTKTYEQFTRSHGLPDNDIKALYLINNTLWIGTPSGLASFDINRKTIVNYGKPDQERPETYFTGFNFYYDSLRQEIYVPCNNSIIRFDPFSFKTNTAPPVFFVENIRINNQDWVYHPSGKIELGPGKNNLVVNLASINFDDPLQEQFFYRFKDKGNWQAVGNQKSFLLSNLADGNHDIEFMLSSKTNSWATQVIVLNIYIRPPFWKTTWFIIAAALGLVTLLWLLYRRRIHAVRQKANIDNQLAELEMKSLHAQMNPHFIFNALNSIKEMIWENDKQNASRYLSKFAQLIRTTLEQSRQNFITVKQCVDHLEQYLEMEKIRFDDFSYTIETGPQLETEQLRMAPMLVQPLVENGIWHGLKNTPGEKLLSIKFYQEKNHIVCEIADNGPGIHHQPAAPKTSVKHRSISIENIRNRLQMLNEKYNMDCSLEFIDKADRDPSMQGTIAILRLSV